MNLAFIQIRCRFVVGWIISELTCCVAGVGFDPHSPPHNINRKYFQTIDLQKVDCSDSLREMMQGWNCSVQGWMFLHIYKRIPVTNKLLAKVVTMFVSAFWHGMHPGYYMSFLAAPFFFLVQNDCWTALKNTDFAQRYLTGEYTSVVFFLPRWFVAQVLLNFLAVPFVCLSVAKSLQVWRAVSYYGHVLGVALLVLTLALRKRQLKTKKVFDNNTKTVADDPGDVVRSNS
eukprot:Platyproteum_vivax@DN6364_c0_g1_i1.p1